MWGGGEYLLTFFGGLRFFRVGLRYFKGVEKFSVGGGGLRNFRGWEVKLLLLGQNDLLDI